MKLKTLLLAVMLLLPIGAIAQCTSQCYVDPLYTGGGNNGTSTNPYTSIALAMTGAVNTNLLTQNVTIFISASDPTNTTEQAIDGFAASQRTSTGTGAASTFVLTLDGMSKYQMNTNHSAPGGGTWATNFIPSPCTGEDCAKIMLSGVLKAKMTGSVPLDSTNSFSNCKGFITIHGFDIANNNGQTANLTYIHDLVLEYSELHRIGVGLGGPGVYIGPGQHGPCHTGAARPGGTDNGPDNVTVQYNYIHETWGECIYAGASTPDPFVNGAPGSSQQVEGGTAGDNLQCGNGCAGNASCTTASSANASTCHTGDSYLIQGNTIESCAAWGGQGDGTDIKDGHTNLKSLNNSLHTTKFPACAPNCTNLVCYGGTAAGTACTTANDAACTGGGRCGAGNDGRAMIIESCSLIDSNFIEAPAHDAIDDGISWNTSTGRASCQHSNNIIVDVNSGIGHQNGIELESLNVTGLAPFVNMSYFNNSMYNIGNNAGNTGACFFMNSGGASGTVLTENNICDLSTSSGTFNIGTHDYNDYFQATGKPGGEGIHSITTDPKYRNTATPYVDTEFTSQAGAGVLGFGLNLSATFTKDYFGTLRYSPWNIGAFQATSIVCGPPTWNCPLQGTSTQLSVIQQPLTPNLGNLSGANLSVIPAGYGNLVIRCTDVNTSSVSFTSHSYDVTDSGGGFDQIWNSAEDLLAIVQTNSSQGTIVAFNATTNQCSSPQPSLQIPTGRAWSRTNPNLMRVVPNGGTGTLLKDYTFNHVVPSTAPVITTEFDFGTCGGMSGITATWSASVTSSTNDTVVATGFSTTGGQNTGILVAVYNPSSGGCQVWNTNTGTITATGYGVSGTATTNFPFNVHDVTVWPGGWVEVGVGTTCTGCPSPHGPFFWQAGTLNTTLSTSNSGGHNTGMTTNWYNISTSPRFCQRPFSNPTTCTFINDITGITMGTLSNSNTHVTSQNSDANEDQPIFMSHTTTPNLAPSFTSPLQQEIFGLLPNVPPNGRYIRITPTWTSGITSSYGFRANNAISATSPSGTKIAFASDWMGTLGNIDGVTASCTLGTNCRNDVFIVVMPATAAPNIANTCGVSGDTAIHIPPSYDTFLPPALGVTYTDPTFGCPITRVTDAVNNPGSQTVPDPNKAQGKHFYSLVVPDNVNHTIVHVTLDGLPALVAGPVTSYGSTGTILVTQANFPTANLTSQGFVIWDIVDPLTFYYTANNIFKMGKVTGLPGCAATHACTITSTTLATFSSYTAVSLMDDEDISEDGLHYFLGAHSGSAINDAGCSNGGQLCDILFIALNATGGNATTATLVGTPFTNSWWHKIQTPLANRLNIENLNGGGGDVEYNSNGTVFATLNASHHDFLHNPINNNEVIASPWTPGLATNLCPHEQGANVVDTASAASLGCLLEAFMPANSTYGVPPPKAPASHFSTRDLNFGWMLYEAESYAPGTCPDTTNPYCEQGVGNTTSMTNWGLYDGELVAAKVDGSQFLRLAHTRSRSGTAYWAGARAVITRDAKYVYFDSNFNSCTLAGGCGFQTTTLDTQYTDMYVLQFQSTGTALCAACFAQIQMPRWWAEQSLQGN